MFAYGDDIAVLCLSYSDIRAALDVVEYWSVANSMVLNKKKCGILSIYNKTVPLGRMEIDGVSFVSEY